MLKGKGVNPSTPPLVLSLNACKMLSERHLIADKSRYLICNLFFIHVFFGLPKTKNRLRDTFFVKIVIASYLRAISHPQRNDKFLLSLLSICQDGIPQFLNVAGGLKCRQKDLILFKSSIRVFHRTSSML